MASARSLWTRARRVAAPFRNSPFRNSLPKPLLHVQCRRLFVFHFAQDLAAQVLPVYYI